MVTKVITDLDFSKESCPGCVTGVVLKNCEHEVTYVSADPFNMCLKEFWVLDYLKFVFSKGCLGEVCS